MSTHRVFQRNDNIVVEQVGGTIKIKTDGVTPPPDPVFSGVPDSPSNFGLDGLFPGFSFNRAADPLCRGTQKPEELNITFTWDINDQANDPLHFYAIRRVPTEFVGVDNTATGWPSGFGGQYGLSVPGVVSGALDNVTNFEPYIVNSISQVNSDVSATTFYGSDSSFYQYGFTSSNTPKYNNGLGITSIQFSNIGSEASPKITFRDNTEKTRFRGLEAPMRFIGATGTLNQSYVTYDIYSMSGSYELSTANIVAEDSTSITYQSMPSSELTDLLDDIAARGTNNQWLYIQISTDDEFSGRYINQKCLYSTDIPSPLILRRDILTPDAGQFKIVVSDYECDDFGFQMLALNPSGQSIPTYTGIEEMTTLGESWLIKEGSDASIFDSGSASPNEFGVQYGGSNGFEGYFVVPSGYVATMLYASGFIYEDDGTLAQTGTSTNSGGTGGKILVSRPSQGWYYAEAQEQWRLSGPSGDIIETITSLRCGDNYILVNNPPI